MNENPFIITDRISPKYFCDRQKETFELIKLLVNGNNVVMMSPRRVGKTSLIQYVFEKPEIKKNYITIYIDILSTGNLQEFTFLLGREVFSTIRGQGRKLWQSFVRIVKSLAGKISIDPLTGVPNFSLQLGDIREPEYTLKEIFQYLSESGKACILAIDEFQQISNYPEKNIEALLRSQLQQICNCRMIYSGSERHILAEMFTSTSKPFYHSASIMELGVIEKNYYIDFIIEMFGKGGKKISGSLAERIYDIFDGITFYIQRVCNGIYSETLPGGSADEGILDGVVEGILASYDLIYRLRLSQLTTRQKELLFAISKEKTVEKITSTEFIRRHSLSSSSAVQTALNSLLNREIIVKTERGYEVDDRFFRLWIERNF